MENKGLTLIELMVVLLITACMVLVMTCQFIAQATFGAALINQTSALSEVSVAMYELTTNLRFIDASTVNTPTTTSITGKDASASSTITYSQDVANHTITRTIGLGATTVIASNISYFNVSYDSASQTLTLQVTATVPIPATANSRSSSLGVSLRVPPY